MCVMKREHKEMYYTRCNKHSICIDCSIKLLNKTCPFVVNSHIINKLIFINHEYLLHLTKIS